MGSSCDQNKPNRFRSGFLLRIRGDKVFGPMKYRLKKFPMAGVILGTAAGAENAGQRPGCLFGCCSGFRIAAVDFL